MTSALETLRAAPGLDAYLEQVEERLRAAVSGHPGLVARVSEDALAAGGKRLRPTLAFLSSPSAPTLLCAQAPPSSSCTWRPSSTTTWSTERR